MALSTEDRFSIHELLARIAHAVDAQDWDTYMSFFHPEARMDPGFADPAEGSAAIRAFLEATEANVSGKRHVTSNVFIDDLDGRVVAHSYLTVVEREDIPRVVATAYIEDTVLRTNGRWLVREHVVRVDPGMFKAFEASRQTGE